jgi:hypothetical protein
MRSSRQKPIKLRRYWSRRGMGGIRLCVAGDMIEVETIGDEMKLVLEV